MIFTVSVMTIVSKLLLRIPVIMERIQRAFNKQNHKHAQINRKLFVHKNDSLDKRYFIHLMYIIIIIFFDLNIDSCQFCSLVPSNFQPQS